MVKGPPERTKVVIRKLPPTLSSADLKAAVDEVCDGQYVYHTFVPGKSSAKAVKHARAYLYFKDPLQVYDFRAAFDGHIFVNEKGAQFRCSVEYAPYQGIPKKISKKDPREGTLETDAEYLEFVATLEKEPELLPSADNQVSEAKDAPQKKRVTPLMQFLHDKWTGKHHVSAPKQPQSRQRRKTKDTESNLPPPPGFDALPKSGGKPPKGKGRQSSKSSPADDKQGLEAAQEAVAAALQGVELVKPAPSAKEKTSKRRSRKDSSEQDEASKPAQAKAPTRILKKEQDQTEDPPAESESKPRRERKQRSKQAKEDATGPPGQANTRTAPSRPVRVRAGFQVYTPRSRAQPGETLAAKGTFAPARSEAADGAEEGTPVPSTEEQEQMEIARGSWDKLINAPAAGNGTIASVDGASMSGPTPGQDAGSEPPNGSSEGQAVSQAAANELAQPPEQTGDQLSEGRSSASRGRGGRRNWRRADGVTEPSGD